MLAVRGLSKQFMRHGRPHELFQDLSFDLARNGRIAVLGRNGQGKSTLIKILGGVTSPTSGSVRWAMSNSWPLGFGGGFQGGLRTIVPLAGPAERAGVIAVVYVICYLALGLPAIGAGVLVVHTTVTHTALLFGLGVIALAASTAAGILLSERRTRASETKSATTGCVAAN